MMASDPEVLIVGAGPTGLTAAIELARRGVAVRVVDNDLPRPPSESRALSISAYTQELFERAGLLAPLRTEAQTMHGLSIYGGHRRIGRLNMVGLESPHPAMVLLRQAETEALMLARLAALGVSVERPVEVTGVRQDEGGVYATVFSENGPRDLRARYLIGADGAHSRVRKGLNLSFEGEASGIREYLADCRVEWRGHSRHMEGAAGELFIFLGPPHFVMFGYIGSGLWRLLVMGPASDPTLAEDRPALAVLQRIIDDHPELDARLLDMTWSSSFGQSARKVEHLRHGRIFLAGDAAQIQSPFGGQGMNAGIADAANLAWKLALHLRGHGGEALLDSYHEERNPIRERLLRVATSGVEGFLASKGVGPILLRNTVLGAWGHVGPALRLARRFMGGYLDEYRASPLVEDHLKGQFGSARGPAAGERAPDAGGLLLGGRTLRLFEAWGDDPRHPLLIFPGASANPTRRVALHALTQGLNARYGQLLRPLLVGAGPEEAGEDVLVDLAGELANRYGAQGERLYLLRPDGFVGLRGTPSEISALHAHLCRVYVA